MHLLVQGSPNFQGWYRPGWEYRTPGSLGKVATRSASVPPLASIGSSAGPVEDVWGPVVLVPSAPSIIAFTSISHSSSVIDKAQVRASRVLGTGTLTGALVRRNAYRDANSRRGVLQYLEVRHNIRIIRIKVIMAITQWY